ncbi:MAG: HAD family hydrolase [Spirochaetota bacterium]
MGTFETGQVGLFVKYSTPLAPISPDLPHDLRPLVGRALPRPPRAILFDVYGTLVVSGSGDVGAAAHAATDPGTPAATGTGSPFLRAFEIASGTSLPPGAEQTMRRTYHDAIARSHLASKSAGIAHPEVDITRIWRAVLEELAREGLEPAPVDVQLLAIAYETLANPAWPMPGALSLLELLRGSEPAMGIVSNAQFYTERMIRALFGSTPRELGFDPALIAYSYEAGRAKPDPALFDTPLAELERRGIDSTQTVYVGNDMRNDVAAARSRECMTVLFAGDRRSLRLRRDSPGMESVRPDAVAPSLDALPGILGLDHASDPSNPQGE